MNLFGAMRMTCMSKHPLLPHEKQLIAMSRHMDWYQKMFSHGCRWGEWFMAGYREDLRKYQKYCEQYLESYDRHVKEG